MQNKDTTINHIQVQLSSSVVFLWGVMFWGGSRGRVRNPRAMLLVLQASKGHGYSLLIRRTHSNPYSIKILFFYFYCYFYTFLILSYVILYESMKTFMIILLYRYVWMLSAKFKDKSIIISNYFHVKIIINLVMYIFEKIKRSFKHKTGIKIKITPLDEIYSFYLINRHSAFGTGRLPDRRRTFAITWSIFYVLTSTKTLTTFLLFLNMNVIYIKKKPC